MRHIKRTFVVAALVLCAMSCEKSTDRPSVEAQGVEKAAIPPRLLDLYQTLNMRSFPSSFGPRLKYYCESYPFEYFPQEGVQVNSATRLTLVSGDDTWIIDLLANNRIRLETKIAGSGSYHAVDEYDLHEINAAGDLRADAQWIAQKADCKALNAEKKTKLGLVDARNSRVDDGWICGEYWGGGSVTAELVHWKTLAQLPQERDPSRNRWGAADMLLLRVTDQASLSGRCAPGEQIREVRATSVYDQPGGTETGKFVRISTYSAGLLDMAGFVALNENGSHKVNFDLIAKEQPVLVIAAKDGDWIDISTADGVEAWIKMSDFEPNRFAVELLPYLQRLASADELNFVDDAPRPVHSDASDNAPVVYTLRDERTAMHPITIRDNWMQVRFVAPPEYPVIGCGDEESKFDWITGWIRWRDAEHWYVTEEHHHGC